MIIDHLTCFDENWNMVFWKQQGGEKRKRFILAIDGGGMRGIIPAYILQMLNKELRKLGDERPLYSHFDLIAGTSTGALIAAALSIPVDGTLFQEEDINTIPVYDEVIEKRLFRKRTHRIERGKIRPSSSPDSYVSFYTENGKKIFPQRGVSAILGPIFSDKYSGSEYESFLKKLYGDKNMGELMIPTVLLSYSTDSGIIYPITNWEHQDFKIWEGTRASTAAPLYFPEFIKEYKGKRLHLIDGGIAANNPTPVAYTLAHNLYGDAEYHILSLSTGTPVYKSTQEQNLGGITGWGGQISKVFQNAQSSLTDFVFPSIPATSYSRIWAPVLERKIRLDETGKESINTLMKAAEDMYEKNKETLDGWAKLLAEHPVSEYAKLIEPTRLPQPSREEES